MIFIKNIIHRNILESIREYSYRGYVYNLIIEKDRGCVVNYVLCS